MDIEAMIGLAAAPALIPILVSHIKDFAHALARWLEREQAPGGPEGSPWPLVADALGVLWALGLWQSGDLPDEVTSPITAVMVGLALGAAASTLRDQVVRALPR